jgi:integrase
MLNDAKIKAAKAKDKPYRLSDSGQLYLQVSPAGGKHWRMNYTFGRNAAGKPAQKTLSFGSYPAVTLVEARGKRDSAKALLRDGKDPGLERKISVLSATAEQANTFELVARDWHKKQVARWSKIHAKDVLDSLEENVFPKIGALPISTIKAPKLLEVLSAIEKRGAIETAHRIRSRISSVFVFAVASGLAEADPAASLGRALQPIPRGKKQPALTDLKLVQQMLVDCEAERCRASTKLALRLLALTAVRPGELRGARWEEFELDGDNPLWRIPAERMKGTEGRKAEEGGEHLVPLAPASVEILRVLYRLSGDLALVFPSERHPHRPISENTLRALLIRAGYFQRHVPHGFRAAFSTIMNERAERAWRAAGQAGTSPDRAIIDLMLSHVPKDKVEGAYNRAAYMPRRREIAEEWAELLVGDFWPPEVHLGQPIRYQAGRP